MSYGEDELLPVVTVSLFDRAEVEGLVMSALDGSMALVPTGEIVAPGTYILELCSPDRARPLVLAGEVAGDSSGGMCPMFLRPIDADNAEELLAFLGRASLAAGELDAVASARPLAEVRILTPRPSRPSDLAGGSDVAPSTDRSSIAPAALVGSTRPLRPSAQPAAPPPPPAPVKPSEPPEEGRSTVTLQSIMSLESLAEAAPVVEVVASESMEPPPDSGLESVPPTRPADLKSAITLDGPVTPLSSVPPSVTNDPLLGRTLGGKYVIAALIGAGGAGSVYRAHHVMLQKDIAIKVMHPSLRKDPTFGERFHAEALAASKLDHPNVLRVLDYGEEPDGLLYIAMELLVGTELRALLWQGRMPLERSLDIVCQICAALSAASEVGIVHRDIKPENVVITASRDDEGNDVDLVKVCDFGLATIAKTDAETSGEHRAAPVIAGTPEYMSPEQVRGEELDGRSDIYAVGVIIYELVTGRLPFEGSSPIEILKAHLHRQATLPSKIAKDVDPEVEAVVLRTLAKDRSLRPATAREVRAELRNILERVRRGAQIQDAPPPTALPIEDAASGFAELFVALTAAVARTTYYEREHPEFARSLVRVVHAARAPLSGRGEISIAQRDVRDTELLVQTGIGEVLDLRRVLPGGVAEAYAPRLGDVFLRRHVVSFTLKEGVTEMDLADATELLSGPEVTADALRLDFLSRGLEGVSILFSEELLGKSRKLPWHVDLCISRLARDLRALPLLRGVTEDAMRTLRVQLVADVVRGLERPDDIRLLLENTDLVATSVQHVPELGTLDFRSVIVSALRRPLAIAAARHLLSSAGRLTPPPLAPDGRVPPEIRVSPELRAAQQSARALLSPFASRFLRERSPETDDLLRALLAVKVLDMSDLPRELQIAVAAERLAMAMASDPEMVVRKLSTAPDLARYADEIAAASRALGVLARAGDAKTVAVVVVGLVAVARGAAPDDSTKEGLAASAVSSLADEAALAALADALLFGPVPQREPARTVLAMFGAAAARALLAARVKGMQPGEPFPRPRFVAALREVGKPALPALGEHLSRLDPEGVDPQSDPVFAEDLLRALPDVPDEGLGRVVARFLRHRGSAVRRAAAAALPGLLGPRARPPLVHALDDIDEGVRAAALAGIRAIRAVDEDVVTRVEQVLSGAIPASDELRAGAAGALADVRESAKARAVEALVRAIRPKTRSIVSLFKNDADTENVLVLTTVARVLIAIGGAEGRKEVERRASSSRGELKKALGELVGVRS